MAGDSRPVGYWANQFASPYFMLGQDGAHPVDVDHVVGAAVMVHQPRQELDLLVAPAVQPVEKGSHGGIVARGAARGRRLLAVADGER